MPDSLPSPISAYCVRCRLTHELPCPPALYTYARRLMRLLRRAGRIDLGRKEGAKLDPRLSLDYLEGEARGQMFGVLQARDEAGRTRYLKAFSSLYNGVWEVPGWCPPLLDVADYHRLCDPVYAQLMEIREELEESAEESAAASQAEHHRRLSRRQDLSRSLMARIHALHTLHNFRGESLSLTTLLEGRNPPAGTGDCCAPKLLNQAARLGWRPLGLAEFFLGRSNRSGSREDGAFYSPCKTKCAPILGFMLCGLEAPACP